MLNIFLMTWMTWLKTENKTNVPWYIVLLPILIPVAFVAGFLLLFAGLAYDLTREPTHWSCHYGMQMPKSGHWVTKCGGFRP